MSTCDSDVLSDQSSEGQGRCELSGGGDSGIENEHKVEKRLLTLAE